MLKKIIQLFILVLCTLPALSQIIPVMNPINGPANVCSIPSSGATYSCSASNSPLSYQWSILGPSVGIVIANPTASVTLITFPNTNLNYTLVCSAANSAGTATPVNYIIKVYETPQVTFSGGQSFCQGSSTNLSASPTIISASSSLSYTWSPTFGLNPTNSLNVTANPNATTTYSLFLSIPTCTNLATITVTVNPPPSFTPVISNTLFCKLDTQTLTILGNGNTYSINNVLTPSISILSYTVSGGVLITVNGETAAGCKANASITFLVANCTVGLDDKQKIDEHLLIYPNPNKGNFIIQNLNFNQTIYLYDSSGKLLKELNSGDNTAINIKDLLPGLYFIIKDQQRFKVLVN